jgi:hypothetical protein
MPERHTFSITFQANGKVDRANGTIQGVAVVSVGEAKGRGMQIDNTTLEQVKTCAETYTGGLKVKADHGSGIFSVAGRLKNFHIDGDVLRADLYVLESEENRDKLFEMAETMPDTFGLSISFTGPDETKDGKLFARCVEIYSADLVSEPAANPNGLFSANPESNKNMNPEDIQKAIEAVKADLAAFATRLEQLEKGTAPKAEMSALSAEVKTLEAKMADKNEMAAAIAKSFASVVGVPAASAPAAAAAPAAPAEPPAKNFEAIVAEIVATGKTKSEAISLSVKSHPKEYTEFYSRMAKGEVKKL